MKGSTRLRIIIRYSTGFGILAYLLATLDLGNIFEAFSMADIRYLAAGMVLVLTIRVLNAWQLAMAIQHQQLPVTVVKAFLVNTVSGFYSLFLPGGQAGGSVVKWYKLSKPSGRRVEVLATMFFLRVINSAFILLFGIFALMIENPLGLKNVFWVLIALIGGLVGMYLVFFREPVRRKVESYVGSNPGWLPLSLSRGLNKVFISLSQFKTLPGGKTLKILCVPFISQFLCIFLFSSVSRALHLTVPLITLIWIIAVVYMIQSIPASFYGLGLREGALVLLMPQYGVDKHHALAFSLILFSYTMVMGLVGGIIEAKEMMFTPSAPSLDEEENA